MLNQNSVFLDLFANLFFILYSFPSEMSHRSAHFAKIVNEAESDLRELL